MKTVNVNVAMVIEPKQLRKAQDVLAGLSSNAKDQSEMDAIESALGVLAAVADAIPDESTIKATKDTLIDLIASVVIEENDESLSMAQIEADCSPIVSTLGNSYNSVEVLNKETAEVYTYVNGIETDSTTVSYWDLELDVLEDIVTQLKNMYM